MIPSVLKVILVAATTFMIGAPFVVWLVPQAESAVDDNNTTPSFGKVTDPDRRPGDLLSRTGRLMARRIESDEEGVAHTIVFSIESGRASRLRYLSNCIPIAWSTPDDGALLLREAEADCDERHFVWNLRDAGDAPRKYMGCRYCSFQSWPSRGDVITFHCEGIKKRVFASSESAGTVALGHE